MKKINTTQYWAIKIMKWSFSHLCIVIIFANVSFAVDTSAQELLNRPISIQASNQYINSVLSEIEKVADVKFSYSPNLIRASRKITIFASNEKLSMVLERLLTPQKLTYEVINRQIILKREKMGITQNEPLEVLNIPALADITITGTVISENSEQLVGVNIILN